MQAAAQELEVVMIKRKRSSSKRPRLALTMATTDLSTTSNIFADRLTSSSSSSGDRPVHEEEEEEEDMANCLILLARGSSSSSPTYNCKTCNRSFPSFQALGGHRASHGKPNHKPAISPTYNKRPMIREKKYEEDNYQLNSGGGGGDNSLQVSKKSRVHECSICRAEFGSGQALGGHMRRHRPISQARNIILSLDLNLPAPEDIDHAVESNKFPFSPKEQLAILSASTLVDCHY